MADQYDEFLLALRELTLKYGVAIDGCGCCSSPYLADVDVTDPRSGYALTLPDGGIRWICPSEKYDWTHYSAKLIHPESIDRPTQQEELS